jgi:hypothetical protein
MTDKNQITNASTDKDKPPEPPDNIETTRDGADAGETEKRS